MFFFTLESPYPYFCCNLRHNVMPYMYSEMQNKLSKTRDSPLESMGQIISSRCPAALLFTEAIAEARDTRSPLYTACIDASKAFDVVWHKSLLRKLYNSGLT